MPNDKYLTLEREKEKEQYQGTKSLGMSCSLKAHFVLLRQELCLQCVKMWVLQENTISQQTSGKSLCVCALWFV